jgi:hypothetical protein
LRTASSNSIGPGMSSAGCDGWFDIFFGGSGASFFTSATSFLTSCTCTFFGGDGRMRLPFSSSGRALRSVEKGVFSSRKGFESKCLEICLRREPARDDMLARGCRRQLTDRRRNRGAANIRCSETCDMDGCDRHEVIDTSGYTQRSTTVYVWCSVVVNDASEGVEVW